MATISELIMTKVDALCALQTRLDTEETNLHVGNPMRPGSRIEYNKLALDQATQLAELEQIANDCEIVADGDRPEHMDALGRLRRACNAA